MSEAKGGTFVKIVKTYKPRKCDSPICPSKKSVSSCTCCRYDFCDEACHKASGHECKGTFVSNELITGRIDKTLFEVKKYIQEHGLKSISEDLPCVLTIDLTKVPTDSEVTQVLTVATKSVGKAAAESIDNRGDYIVILDHYKIKDNKCLIIDISYNLDSRMNNGSIIAY